VSTFCVLFRHSLILAGQAGPANRRQIVSAAAAYFRVDAAPLNALLDFREGLPKPKDTESEALLAAYLKQVEIVISAVDALAK
jgi:hypothetical protein